MDAKLAGGTDRAHAMSLFVAVVDQGSFSAAGRLLGMSPSAVARAVDRIEARLGVRLLLRSTRALSLTAEGLSYLQAARRILADLDEAEQRIADQGSPRGRLRISAAFAHGRLSVVPLLGQFAALYPDILIDVSLTDTLIDIAGGQADVAVRFGPLPDSTLTARKVGETRRVIVASPEYLARHGTPSVPEDLFAHNCLNFSFRRAEPVWLARVGTFGVADDIASGALVPLLEAFNPGDIEQIHAVFVGGANTPARVRVFVDFLAAHLR